MKRAYWHLLIDCEVALDILRLNQLFLSLLRDASSVSQQTPSIAFATSTMNANIFKASLDKWNGRKHIMPLLVSTPPRPFFCYDNISAFVLLLYYAALSLVSNTLTKIIDFYPWPGVKIKIGPTWEGYLLKWHCFSRGVKPCGPDFY